MASLKNFSLKTPNSAIYNETELRYSSFSSITEAPGEIKFTTDLGESSIGTRDISWFIPSLAAKLRTVAGSDNLFFLKGEMHGEIGNMKIENFVLNNRKNLIVGLEGSIRGLPDVKTAYYNINIDTVSMRRYHLYSFMPDSVIPSSLQIPSEMYLSGNFKGSMNDFSSDITFNSSQGQLAANVKFASGAGTTGEKYSGNISIRNYDLGELLQNEKTLGEITMNGQFSGRSRDFKNIDAGFTFHIDKAVAKQYAYNDIDISGDYRDKLFKGELNIKDSNLIADFKGKASLGDSIPEYDFTLFIQGIDLMALNLSKEDIRLRGTLVSDFRGNEPDEINGFVKAKDFIIMKNKETFRLDSFVARASNSDGSSEMEVNSPVLTASYKGTVAFDRLGTLLKQNVSHYFELQNDTIQNVDENEEFSLEINIPDTELLTKILLPGLKNFMPAYIQAEYNGSGPDFDMTALFPRIQYNNIILDTLSLEASSGQEQLNYDFGFKHLQSPPFEVGNTDVSGIIAGDSNQVAFSEQGSEP